MKKHRSIVEKLLAEKLRKTGKTHREIAEKLQIAVSTAHLWTKNIQLSERVRKHIHDEHIKAFLKARKTAAGKQKQQRLLNEKQIFFQATKKITPLSKNELFFFGIALYWAEGFKNEYSMGFVNSDPFMVKYFLKWLYVFGKIKPSEIHMRVQINRRYSSDIHRIQSHWSTMLKIPLNQFQQPFFQHSNNATFDPNYFGLIRIRVVRARKLFVHLLGYIEGVRKLVSTK